jgi:hypothetical protein
MHRQANGSLGSLLTTAERSRLACFCAGEGTGGTPCDYPAALRGGRGRNLHKYDGFVYNSRFEFLIRNMLAAL